MVMNKVLGFVCQLYISLGTDFLEVLVRLERCLHIVSQPAAVLLAGQIFAWIAFALAFVHNIILAELPGAGFLLTQAGIPRSEKNYILAKILNAILRHLPWVVVTTIVLSRHDE